MRSKLSAGAVVALAFLIPAAPAVAHTGAPAGTKTNRSAERKVYRDLREIVTIDPDTATSTQVRLVANRILFESTREALPVLPDAVQAAMDGTEAQLRTFLKTGLPNAWATALRISVVRTLTDAGPHVYAAAQQTLDTAKIDAYLTFLNVDLYTARELDLRVPPRHVPQRQV
ncbi:cell wall anchor domain-containing protein [Actinoplanes sp. SE50]|uniref:cell wall anchor domain-containing protein n=1 Tax=unclassified Actinoplanes TaxID=2626549 RepID=UPI00023EBD8A|nr:MULTISPECIES: cell wall anchor domain-containing protein [unclassified Actinoplanes]AEV85724.1 cell wall anchor domain-containing protein [Actinoplanes sp. SE50/110]ATO84117.1 cell wall anchor domain-containing protein [Actinoplanes sp. SE50]SLM01527.1 cell wall anchor domain-containing protein [Actinoplanes sp. SE50/110]